MEPALKAGVKPTKLVGPYSLRKNFVAGSFVTRTRIHSLLKKFPEAGFVSGHEFTRAATAFSLLLGL
jgi:hypothetical protein